MSLMTQIRKSDGARPTPPSIGFRALALFVLGLSAMAVMGAERPDPAAVTEKRIALVIGNNKYPSAPLRNPVNDANAMAKKLREMGFEVILRTDVDLRQLTRAVSEFGTKLTLGSVGLFYYAGHGIQARGRNFLVPIDADITTEGSVSSESVDVERVLDQLSPARLAMVVLDACRNNPFERRFRSGAGRGLAQIDAPAGTLIAYATAPGKIALDGEGAHGTYTEALLQAIESPGLKVEDVFKQVRIQVLKVTNNQQVPWESSSLTGEFAFRPAKVAVVDQREQKKQEQETAALREQMAQLSAEMTRMRESRSVSAPAPDAARLEQEQKKAQQEAAVVREQMALLTAEIIKLRENRPAPGPVPVSDEQQRKSVQETAALRDQVALMSVEISKLRDSRPAPGTSSANKEQEQKKVEQATAEMRQQVASLNAEISKVSAVAPQAVTSADTAAWKKQIAKLEGTRGRLKLATAVATLLDIASEADLATLRKFEGEAMGRAYSNALALGVDASGLLVWGGSHGQRRAVASEVALDFCAGAGGTNCKAVVLDGSFSEERWLEIAKQLGTRPIEAVRTAFLSSLTQPILSTVTVGGMPGNREAAGYTFARSSAK